ncbi:hypothetical protein [Limosilactobacillus fermentum]|uniref:hypothetical protein n=1 Tax=Limosilactobacillus fermentum TaxID=1613 RepID=UPI0012AB6831|nr:hypothetical protein [Limosilactobacillus fermentum]
MFKLAPKRSFKRSRAWVCVNVAVDVAEDDDELPPFDELKTEAVEDAADRDPLLLEEAEEVLVLAEELEVEEPVSSDTVLTCCFLLEEFFFVALLLVLTLLVVSPSLADLLPQAANDNSIAPATIEVNSFLAFINLSSHYLELRSLITL